MTASFAVVVPTRDRPALARNAVRSLLDQDCELDVFVSDNSRSPDALADIDDPGRRVHRLRPASDLAMADHWDWAIREAMQRSSATHFVVHHDRRWSTPRSWGAVADIATRWPDDLITVGVDSISDVPPPLRLWQQPWTGQTFAIRTSAAAAAIASARVAPLAHALPLLISVVPRAVLQSVIDRFGDICRSTGPDSAFMARFLALHDRYLCADRVTGVMYAAHRSTNHGYLKGAGGDFGSFVRQYGDHPWLAAAPVPGVNLGSNMLFHEYELVRRETGDRLPALDVDACLRELGEGLRWIDDAVRQQELAAVLREHGWRGEVAAQPSRPSWRERVREALVLARGRCGIAPHTITGFAFRSDDTALRNALRFPRQVQQTPEHLSGLEPEVVGP